MIKQKINWNIFIFLRKLENNSYFPHFDKFEFQSYSTRDLSWAKRREIRKISDQTIPRDPLG
jgi:hypothetical protein